MIIAVTGTSRGIGRALAERFASQGHQVFGCSRSEATPIENVTHVPVDVAAPDGARTFFRAIRRTAGRLDALINNAAVAQMNHFMMMPDEANRSMFDVNVHALLACSREAVGLMAKSEHPAPSIVNFTSVATCWSIPGQLAYAASKAAVEQATRTMSRELAANNVRVNAVGLPPVRTALTRTVPREKIDALVERQALRRMCTVEDVFGPVEFLISPAAAFVTGETLYLGGVR